MPAYIEVPGAGAVLPTRERRTPVAMLTSSELKKIPIFSCLNDANLEWLSQQTADIHLEPGEYLIHEGEPTEPIRDLISRPRQHDLVPANSLC